MIDLSLSYFHFVESSKRASGADRLVLSPTGIQIKSSPSKYSWDTLFHGEQIKQENAKAWQAFRRTISETYGAERVERICQKYDLNPDQQEKEGRPLQKRHIDMLCIGAEQIYAHDLRQLTDRSLEWLPRDAIRSLITKLNPFPYIPGADLSIELLDGGPSDLRAYVSHNPLLMDTERAILLRDLSSLSPYSFLERVTKTLANRELEPGMVLPAPGQDGREDFYTVHKKVCGEGLVAYALKPLSKYSHLKPLVIFRPTQATLAGEDAPQSWLNDLERHIGKMGYDATKAQFEALMADPTFCEEGQKIEIAGYSLGGTHAQRFLNDYASKICKANFFNDPSIDAQTAEEFAKKVNALPEVGKQQLSIMIYRTKGDVAHYVGEKHIGWGVTHPEVDIEIIELDSVEDKLLSLLTRHAVRFFDQIRHEFVAARFRDEEIDRQLDNSQRGVEVAYWENLRKWGHYLLYPFVSLIYRVTLLMHRHFHCSPFRYTEERRPLPLLSIRA